MHTFRRETLRSNSNIFKRTPCHGIVLGRQQIIKRSHSFNDVLNGFGPFTSHLSKRTPVIVRPVTTSDVHCPPSLPNPNNNDDAYLHLCHILRVVKNTRGRPYSTTFRTNFRRANDIGNYGSRHVRIAFNTRAHDVP